MKRLILTIGAVLFATTASAETIGASLKPVPRVTIFGQTFKCRIPSVCLGAAAGVLPDAKLSAEGVNIKLPYFAVDIPFPSLILAAKGKEVEVKLGEIKKVAEKKK